MRKMLFVLGMMMGLFAQSQITYHNYLDCSSEWRYYVGGSGVFGQSFSAWYTKYFDGDTLINGLYYYRQKIAYKDLQSSGVTIGTADFIREDSNANFISFYDDTLYQFKRLGLLNVGDNFIATDPFLASNGITYNSNCAVTQKSSFTLGTRTLKAIYGVDMTPTVIIYMSVFPCVVEGVGAVFPDLCGMGCCDRPIYYMYYYTKQYDTLNFNRKAPFFPYDSFPAPVRTYLCNAPLPLKLLSFTAKLQAQNSVVLKWQTANEVNVSYINIQRSDNGKDFGNIGKINASCCSYEFIDGLPSTVYSRLYYRLEIVDKDGSKTYSEIKPVDRQPSTVNSISVYPNPAKDIVTIECVGTKELLIVDYLGKTVYQSTVNSRPKTVNTKQLTKGIYVVKAIMNNGEIKTEKLVVE